VKRHTDNGPMKNGKTRNVMTLIDLRSVFPDQDEIIVSALRSLA
jgi:hypothetical protein